MPEKTDYIAIDMAKESFEVKTDELGLSLKNKPQGFKRLLKEAIRLNNPLVVVESTGGYERPMIRYLHEHKIAVCLVNPTRTKYFILSEGQKAKSDKIDAAMILRYAHSKELQAMPIPDPTRQKMQALMDRRLQMNNELTREKLRLDKCDDSIVKYIKESMRQKERQIAKLEKEIAALEKSDEELHTQAKIMREVCGVSFITSWAMLAYLPELGRISREAIVALVGIAPFVQDSGKFKGQRKIEAGRKKVRNILFNAANSARQHNPEIMKLYNRLEARGKVYKCNLVACMRKLLIHLNTIMKNYYLTQV